MTRAFPFVFCLLPVCAAHAQGQRFTLTSCPSDYGVVKKDFDARHGNTATFAEYVQQLHRTFTGDKGGRYVHFTMRNATDQETDYVFNIPSARAHPAGLVSLSSKGVASSTVESKAELRAWLSDTLALWDALRIRMQLLDADLAHDGYFLLWTDPRDGKVYRSAVPAHGDTIRFSAALFDTYRGPWVSARLRHTALRKQDLAQFTLRVMSPGEQEELLTTVCTAARSQGLDAVQRRQLFHQYCTAEYGYMPPSQLPDPQCAPHE